MAKTIIESVNPNSLTIKEIYEIAEVEKDMWAHWIWEYVRCNNCWEIHSKNDVYWHLESDIKKESVTKLEEILWYDSINCNKCDSNNTDFIYNVSDNAIEIQKRLLESKVSFLSILKNVEGGNIIWFMDWYIDDLFSIYSREFSWHYKDIWYEKIKNWLSNTIKESWLTDLFVISSLWTVEKNKWFKNILDLIRNLFFSISKEYEKYLTIAEFDTWSNIHSFFHAVWFEKANIDFNSNVSVANSSEDYESGIYYHRNLLEVYKNNFSYEPKDFVKLYWKKMKEVLIA